MKISITGTYFSVETPTSIPDFVEGALSPDGYGYPGATEYAQETVNMTKRAFGRLLETLANKGVIHGPDVVKIVRGYCDGDITTHPD